MDQSKPVVAYKVRRKSDGLFSCGGALPLWNEVGKTWSRIGDAKNHINLMLPYYKNYTEQQKYQVREILSNLEIVELHFVITEGNHNIIELNIENALAGKPF